MAFQAYLPSGTSNADLYMSSLFYLGNPYLTSWWISNYQHQILQSLSPSFSTSPALTLPLISPVEDLGPLDLSNDDHDDAIDEPRMKLLDEKLWKKFNEVGTMEMVITKAGRQLYPQLKVSVSGLDPTASYIMAVDFLDDGFTYKFQRGKWEVATDEKAAEEQSRLYIHPESPKSGEEWMNMEIISFQKLKLTNSGESHGIPVRSSHMYKPRFHLVKAENLLALPYSSYQSFIFEETEFVAVTAYQNENITQMKIAHNPFAKGFRGSAGNSLAWRKRERRRTRSMEKVALSPSVETGGDTDTGHECEVLDLRVRRASN